MSGTTRCRRELSTVFIVTVVILMVVHVLPRSSGARRNRHASAAISSSSHGMPPDTNGFFFGKRIPTTRGAGMGMHPNANNLMFGKRSPSLPRSTEAASIASSMSSDMADLNEDELVAANVGEICRSMSVVCASVWSTLPTSEESEPNSY